MTTVHTTAPEPRWILRVAAAAILVASLGATLWSLGNPVQPAATRIMFAAVVATYLAVGILILERRRGNAVGAVLFAFGTFLGTYLALDAVIAAGDQVAVAQMAAWIVSLMDAPLFILVALLFLLFPDGRLPSPRWRWLLIADVALGTVVVAWAAFSPGPLTYFPRFENPFGRPEAPLATIGPVAYGLIVGSVGLAALSLVGRWRRGGPVERAQLKWVALSAMVLSMTMAAYSIVIGPGRTDPVFDLLVSVAFATIPVAIGIAILRYRLFEIDRLVSRTIAYSLVTGGLVLVFLVVNLTLTTALSSMTGVDSVAVAASTLIVAALFTPIRRRVQRFVDRRFDRARYDADQTSIAFSGRLRHEVDLPAVTADLDATVRSAIAPTSVGVWLRSAAR